MGGLQSLFVGFFLLRLLRARRHDQRDRAALNPPKNMPPVTPPEIQAVVGKLKRVGF